MASKQTGFTIIEVLIVMAIAGLMLLIVFMAVPNLQRSNRNSRRKHDASIIGAQRLTYDMDIYTNIAAPPGGYSCTSPITSKPFCRFIDDQLSMYTLDQVTFHSNSSVQPTTIPTVTSMDQILTDSYYVCDALGHNAVVSSQKFDQVVLFLIETAGGTQQQCLQNGLTSH